MEIRIINIIDVTFITKLGSYIDDHLPDGKRWLLMPGMAANLLTSVMVCSSPTIGIDPREVEY